MGSHAPEFLPSHSLLDLPSSFSVCHYQHGYQLDSNGFCQHYKMIAVTV